MRNNTFFRTALSIACLLTVTGIVAADTKVKSRQTSGGQTYENTIYIKGKRQRSEASGGQMVTIEQCDLRRNLQLMPAAKVYTINPYDDGTPSSTANTTNTHTAQPEAVKKGGVVTSTVTTKDTGERKQMFGYTARHIITTMSMESSPDACSQNNTKIEIDGWYIDATFALDCDSNRQYTYTPPVKAGGCRDRYETKTIGTAKKGFAVYEKMTMLADGGRSFTTINEVVEISQATLEQSLFEIPPDYRQVDDFASAFTAAYANPQASTANSDNPSNVNTPSSQPSSSTATSTSAVGPKRAGVIRIGVVAVKPGNVAEGMNAQQLAIAVQNTLIENLKASNVEAIPIEGNGGIQAEAQQKECDYLVFGNVSHKKGGGGFGSFMNSAAGKVASNVGYGSSTTAAGAPHTTRPAPGG